jgi:hypothetical protein
MDKLDKITRDFWRIYYCKYIQKMSEFSKWKFKDDENKIPNVGDVVGMLDFEQPSGHFGLAVVSEIHPSKDGKVRKISIQTCRPSTPGHPRPLRRVTTRPVLLERAVQSCFLVARSMERVKDEGNFVDLRGVEMDNKFTGQSHFRPHFMEENDIITTSVHDNSAVKVNAEDDSFSDTDIETGTTGGVDQYNSKTVSTESLVHYDSQLDITKDNEILEVDNGENIKTDEEGETMTEDEFDEENGDERKEKTRDVVYKKPVKLVRWFDKHIQVWIIDKKKRKKIGRH